MDVATDCRRIEDEVEILVVDSGTDAITLAKDKEIQSWIANNVFEEIPDEGQEAMSMRWVVTEKIKEDKKVVKARLVARGFEEQNVIRSDSPTCSKENIRLALVIMASNKWELHSIDVKSAFLQGDEIDRTVLLKPPKDVGSSYLWK